MQFHTTNHKFDTVPGLKLADDLNALFKKFNLGKVWGKSPQDYTLWRDPSTSDNSVLKLFAEKAVPKALSDVPSVAPSRYFIIGTGVLRYDVFKGEFDQNDQLTASSYPDKFWCIPNVPLGAAKATAQRMNNKTTGVAHSFSEPRHAWRRDPMEVDEIRLRWLEAMGRDPVPESRDAQPPRTLGYVTPDVSVFFSAVVVHQTEPYSAPRRTAARVYRGMATTHPMTKSRCTVYRMLSPRGHLRGAMTPSSTSCSSTST